MRCPSQLSVSCSEVCVPLLWFGYRSGFLLCLCLGSGTSHAAAEREEFQVGDNNAFVIMPPEVAQTQRSYTVGLVRTDAWKTASKSR